MGWGREPAIPQRESEDRSHAAFLNQLSELRQDRLKLSRIPGSNKLSGFYFTHHPDVTAHLAILGAGRFSKSDQDAIGRPLRWVHASQIGFDQPARIIEALDTNSAFMLPIAVALRLVPSLKPLQ